MPSAPDENKAAAARAAALSDIRDENLDRARQRLSELVLESPESVEAWTNYGALLGELGEPDAARLALERALLLDPTATAAAANLGVLDREAGRLDAAEARFRAILAREPESLGARYNLAHTLFLAARFDEAAEAWREGLRRDAAKTPNQNARLAWALLAAGRATEAMRELRRALDRIPDAELPALQAEASEVLEAIAAATPERRADIDRMRRTLGVARPAPPDFQ